MRADTWRPLATGREATKVAGFQSGASSAMKRAVYLHKSMRKAFHVPLRCSELHQAVAAHAEHSPPCVLPFAPPRFPVLQLFDVCCQLLCLFCREI